MHVQVTVRHARQVATREASESGSLEFVRGSRISSRFELSYFTEGSTPVRKRSWRFSNLDQRASSSWFVRAPRSARVDMVMLDEGDDVAMVPATNTKAQMWVEKYRPKDIKDVAAQAEVRFERVVSPHFVSF